MFAARPILLMTRPTQAAQAFIDRLPADVIYMVDPVFAPLIEIEAITEQIEQGEARGLILTSANAVDVARKIGFTTDLPCFCVGDRTAQAARYAGWSADVAGDTADALVARLTETRPRTPLLHLCGVHRRGKIAQRLSDVGLPVFECPIYDQRVLPVEREVLARMQDCTVVAPLFSPRTARQFVEEFEKTGLIHAIALSDAVAAPLLSRGFASVSIARRPDGLAMMDELCRLLADNARLEAK